MPFAFVVSLVIVLSAVNALTILEPVRYCELRKGSSLKVFVTSDCCATNVTVWLGPEPLCSIGNLEPGEVGSCEGLIVSNTKGGIEEVSLYAHGYLQDDYESSSLPITMCLLPSKDPIVSLFQGAKRTVGPVTNTIPPELKYKKYPQKLLLFDVDGTLTEARKLISPVMSHLLTALKKNYTIGIVGGSDLVKYREQLGYECCSFFDYFFAENGMESYRFGTLIERVSFMNYLGEENYSKLIGVILSHLGSLQLPIRRSRFVELRSGILNVSPIGRDCSSQERLDFEQLDAIKGFRDSLCDKVQQHFGNLNLCCTKGGQISVDIYPKGWDKTFCLKHVIQEGCFTEVYFFGDRIVPGGNDYEIGTHPGIYSFKVSNWEDCQDKLLEYFL